MANTIPQPPRLTGDYRSDMPSISQWLFSLFEVLALGNQFVTADDQFVAENFDPSSLPDPASTTIATAQNTANQGVTLAAAAIAAAAALDRVVEEYGTVTISNTDTSAAVSFANEMEDASFIILANVDSSTGSPATGAFTPSGVSAKAKTGFTLNILAAPGASNSVTYAWAARRNT